MFPLLFCPSQKSLLPGSMRIQELIMYTLLNCWSNVFLFVRKRISLKLFLAITAKPNETLSTISDGSFRLPHGIYYVIHSLQVPILTSLMKALGILMLN